MYTYSWDTTSGTYTLGCLCLASGNGYAYSLPLPLNVLLVYTLLTRTLACMDAAVYTRAIGPAPGQTHCSYPLPKYCIMFLSYV